MDCFDCKLTLPLKNFHNATLKSNNVRKLCNACREIAKEIENKKIEILQYTCKSCKKYFENGDGLITIQFPSYVFCKTYTMEYSRCVMCCNKHHNIDTVKIVRTGGKIGNAPDQMLYKNKISSN